MGNKDCNICFADGTNYQFSYEDIGKAIKFCSDKNVSYIETPYTVISLLTKDSFEKVKEMFK